MMTSKMIVNLNVLSAFMEDGRVMDNLNNTHVITIHQSMFRKRDTHIGQEPT